MSVTVPQAATVGDTVTLQCRYNLEGEPLYTVKWYKGQSEFYRYLPKELPNTQVFPLPGINVDVRMILLLPVCSCSTIHNYCIISYILNH